MQLQGNGTGEPIADIPFLEDGSVDLAAAAAAASAGGGTLAGCRTWYDQTERLDANQTVVNNQIPFSDAVMPMGGLGNGSISNFWHLNLDLGTISFPLFISFAVNVPSGSATRYLMGVETPLSGYVGMTSGRQRMLFGTLLSTSPISIGTRTIGFLANGVNSAVFLDGTSLKTGDSGVLVTDWSNAKIGSRSGASTSNWFTLANAAISEIIVFSCDPTGLAGWSAFVADQKSYFGVP
ncbi:MAG: hypothetical protein R3F13_13270 [Prosthecobacter sp.]